MHIFFLHGAKLRISCLFTVFNNENVCEKRSFFPISCDTLQKKKGLCFAKYFRDTTMKNATKCLYSKNTAKFKAFRWKISSRNNFKFLKSGQLLLAAKAKPIIHGKWSFLVQFFIKCWEGS